METLPHPGDIVFVRGRVYKMRGRVLDAYEGVVGNQVTIEIPAEPTRDDAVETYTFPLEIVELDTAA